MCRPPKPAPSIAICKLCREQQRQQSHRDERAAENPDSARSGGAARDQAAAVEQHPRPWNHPLHVVRPQHPGHDRAGEQRRQQTDGEPADRCAADRQRAQRRLSKEQRSTDAGGDERAPTTRRAANAGATPARTKRLRPLRRRFRTRCRSSPGRRAMPRTPSTHGCSAATRRHVSRAGPCRRSASSCSAA